MKTNIQNFRIDNLMEEITSKKEKLATSIKSSGWVVAVLAGISFFSVLFGSGYLLDSIWKQFITAVACSILVFFVTRFLVGQNRLKIGLILICVCITLVASSIFIFFLMASNSALIAEAQEELGNYRQIIDQNSHLVEISDKAVQLLKSGDSKYVFNATEESKGAFSGKKSSTDGNMNFLESRMKGISNLFSSQALFLTDKMMETKRLLETQKDILQETERKLTQKPQGTSDLKKYMATFENSLLALDQSVRKFNSPSQEIIMIKDALLKYTKNELNVKPNGIGDLAQNQRNGMETIKSDINGYIENLNGISDELQRAQIDNEGLKLYSQANYNPMIACFVHFNVTFIWLILAIFIDLWPYAIVFLHYSQQKEIDKLEKELEKENSRKEE